MKEPKAQMTHKYIRNVSCASGAPRFVKSLDPKQNRHKNTGKQQSTGPGKPVLFYHRRKR